MQPIVDPRCCRNDAPGIRRQGLEKYQKARDSTQGIWCSVELLQLFQLQSLQPLRSLKTEMGLEELQELN